MIPNRSFNLSRPLGLGLGHEEVEARAAAALAKSDGALAEWERRFTSRGPRQHADVYVRAKALGWDMDSPVMRGPWDEDFTFFNAFHDGTWRVWKSSAFDKRHEAEHRIAMGVGLRSMHWPAMQASDPGCWVFAENNRHQEPAVRLAIHEAIQFADAFLVPEGLLREALRMSPHDVGHVTTRLMAPTAAIERRMQRLGIPVEWRPRGVPAPANDARAAG